MEAAMLELGFGMLCIMVIIPSIFQNVFLCFTECEKLQLQWIDF